MKKTFFYAALFMLTTLLVYGQNESLAIDNNDLTKASVFDKEIIDSITLTTNTVLWDISKSPRYNKGIVKKGDLFYVLGEIGEYFIVKKDDLKGYISKMAIAFDLPKKNETSKTTADKQAQGDVPSSSTKNTTKTSTATTPSKTYTNTKTNSGTSKYNSLYKSSGSSSSKSSGSSSKSKSSTKTYRSTSSICGAKNKTKSGYCQRRVSGGGRCWQH